MRGRDVVAHRDEAELLAPGVLLVHLAAPGLLAFLNHHGTLRLERLHLRDQLVFLELCTDSSHFSQDFDLPPHRIDLLARAREVGLELACLRADDRFLVECGAAMAVENFLLVADQIGVFRRDVVEWRLIPELLGLDFEACHSCQEAPVACLVDLEFGLGFNPVQRDEQLPLRDPLAFGDTDAYDHATVDVLHHLYRPAGSDLAAGIRHFIQLRQRRPDQERRQSRT